MRKFRSTAGTNIQSIRIKMKRCQRWCCVYGEWWVRDEAEEKWKRQWKSLEAVPLWFFALF